jgi:hypothetical protein
MKVENQDSLNLAPREERVILDEIRNDHELIHRLNITPQELEALSKCALLGTLTSKQDMLFILRQIREASIPMLDQTALFPKPPELKERNEESGPDLSHIKARVAPMIIPEPGSLETTPRRLIPAKFGVLFWVAVLVAGLVWNGVIILSRWSQNVTATFGSQASQAPGADAWYGRLDHLNVLLFWEVLLVVLIALAIHLKSQRDSRRFKVRPGRSR